MSDHLVVFVDRLARPVPVDPVAQPPSEPSPPPAPVNADASGSSGTAPVEDCDGEGGGEEEPLIQMAECRICQEEDGVSNLETPCACSGSLKYAHRKCVQHWCDEKGDITCEICHQNLGCQGIAGVYLDGVWEGIGSPKRLSPYQPGYTAPPPRPNPEETTIDIGGGWTISGTPLDLRDPRLLAIAEAERQFLDAEYDEYAASNSSGAAFCRSAALILMALLLLRHALSVSDGDNSDDDPSSFFSLFLLRAAGFLLPCYIMAWAISILQRRRQRQEAAALAATQVAFVLQSGQRRGLQFAIAPGPPTLHQEQV
ncbi:E3 ubiquitin-protein ligase MARCH3 [Glycine max]|nr:E3 ubiquitin-protein ligase MARCH3 [Glycine max]